MHFRCYITLTVMHTLGIYFRKTDFTIMLIECVAKKSLFTKKPLKFCSLFCEKLQFQSNFQYTWQDKTFLYIPIFVFRYYDKVEMNLVRGGSRERLIDHHHHLYSNRLHRSVGSGLEQQIKSPSSSDSSRKKNTKVLVISAGPQAEQVI